MGLGRYVVDAIVLDGCSPTIFRTASLGPSAGTLVMVC